MTIRFLIILTLFFIAGIVLPARASHIVGGEVTYTCAGNNLYNVAITIYEDCLTGDPEAIAEDNPAYFRAYDGNGNVFNTSGMLVVNTQDNNNNPYRDSAKFADADNILVPANFSNACINHAPNTCLRRKTFRKQYYLPPNATGYMIVYQRCCRNASIINLVNPSQIGATYFCTIPAADLATCNNSAVYKNYPPQIICINNPLYYDNSATDADGDSLSYQFCDTYIGGDQNNAKPIPNPPPYTDVNYVSPFSFTNPMAGNPPIQIDAVTGFITGTPNLLGRYVVTVCCLEWRNGININTVKREFQFVVTNCSKAVFANFPQLSAQPNTYIVNCTDFTVHFLNTSVGGFAYNWNFGFPGGTSTDFEPTITFPDTGTYVVKLIVNKGSTCPDSITRLVKVYPKFKTDYSVSGLQCPGSPITFTDQTFSTYKPVSNYIYHFGDGKSADSENTTHIYTQGGLYFATFSATNIKGCVDTSVKQVLVERFTPFAGNDTIIVKGEHIFYSATGGSQYTWAPGTNLNDTTIPNPVGYYPDTGRFAYNVHVISSFGCTGDAQIMVYVVGQAAFFIPTAFTPNGDGINDIFKPTTIGYRSLNYFRIYNRWGELVYNAHTLEVGWDGTYTGRQAEVGTYYWVLSTVDRNGAIERYKGDVTLIR
jgi:gliding motility-associated-like protein